MQLQDKQILLIIGGGVAAYKAPDLLRQLQKQGARLRCVLTQAGAQFITPLTLGALSGHDVWQDLFDAKKESTFGHIHLARQSDLIIVVPATANLLAKAAQGLADDLASTLLLASDAPVIYAPAMNVAMWHNPATQANIKTLAQRPQSFVLEPDTGSLACGEEGAGRLPPIDIIMDAAYARLAKTQALKGKTAVVTAGPTRESIDPARYISNYSSGKQGYAIAQALAQQGADVHLISGATNLPAPMQVQRHIVESTQDMHDAVMTHLPCSMAIMAAAVVDWRVKTPRRTKIKKQAHNRPPSLCLEETPDILARICAHKARPQLVIGFAAETSAIIANAKAKRLQKNCDWIVANDISPGSGTLGGDTNQFHIIRADGVEPCPHGTKQQCAIELVDRIVQHFHKVA